MNDVHFCYRDHHTIALVICQSHIHRFSLSDGVPLHGNQHAGQKFPPPAASFLSVPQSNPFL